ncbi:MAG TPA: hypothetical protein VFA21_13805 [Pyrinomonadaceae bacterium]|nr:hypothetical protein [Pyrinomonadaceae bacterium]
MRRLQLIKPGRANGGNVELITVKEAANLLGLAENTIHNGGAGTSRLERRRFGRAVRLVRQEVEAFRDGEYRQAA